MDSIQQILAKKLEAKKKKKTYYWQEIALEIIQFTGADKKESSSVFRSCKENISAAQRSLTDCKELNKPFVNYYFKVFNEHKKAI
jgi:hypothetical protein